MCSLVIAIIRDSGQNLLSASESLCLIETYKRLCPALKRLASAVQLRPWPPFFQ